MLKVLDLFSGIGGFSLGVELAGWHTVAFCEIELSCRQILKNHWADVPIFEDVTKLIANDLPQKIDVICGGFPCQDISVAGKKAGINGNRSGLWKQYARLIYELNPKYAIIENVANLRSNGLITVLQDLWQIGYDAEWHCIPASSLGAPHQRDRIWIIAYPNSERCRSWGNNRQTRFIQDDQERANPQIHQERGERQFGAGQICSVLANACGIRPFEQPNRRAGELAKESGCQEGTRYQLAICPTPCGANVADTNRKSQSGLPIGEETQLSLFGNDGEAIALANSNSTRAMVKRGADYPAAGESSSGRTDRNRSRADDSWHNQPRPHEAMANANCEGLQGYGRFAETRPILTQEAISLLRGSRGVELWEREPNIPRLAEGKLNPDWVEWLMGFPIGWTEGVSRKHRLKGLGNAVVPIIPELIARCINEFEQCPPQLIQ